MEKTRSYIICATPRSGSTLLCCLLKSTGRAGQPESYFRQHSFNYYSNLFKLPIDDSSSGQKINAAYLEAVRQVGTGDTGCFGLRLMGESLENLSNCLEQLYPELRDDVTRFDRAFEQPKYIYLSRNDKVAQAVSLLKAEQTGLWHMGSDGAEIERTKPHCIPVFDGKRIEEIVANIERLDVAWKQWFEKNKLDAIQVTYEVLSASPKLVFADILSALGMPLELSANVVPRTAKLADKISKQWISRYNAEESQR